MPPRLRAGGPLVFAPPAPSELTRPRRPRRALRNRPGAVIALVLGALVGILVLRPSGNLAQLQEARVQREAAARQAAVTAAAVTATAPLINPGSLWMDRAELARLPMEGAAWERLLERANLPSGTANIADQDSMHDTRAMAVALAYARTGEQRYRDNTIGALLSVVGTEANPDTECAFEPSSARALAVSRNLAAYVIAADLVDLRPDGDPTSPGSRFGAWVDFVRHRPNCPHTPGGEPLDLSAAHDASGSNTSAMAGGARIAAALYLGDRAEVDAAWLTFRRFTGAEVGPDLDFHSDGLTWAHNPDAPLAINPLGATRDGHRIDGAIINDQGRGGPFQWPPAATQYPWEGLQGLYVQAQLLARAGYPAWEVGDRAMLRAIDYQHHLWVETGDDIWWDRAHWVKHLANHAYGTDYPALGPSGSGRNMDWTDWTHAGPAALGDAS